MNATRVHWRITVLVCCFVLTAGAAKFFAGNTKFITRKLWGVGNSGPYMHHGKFTTMREAILAHSGEALSSRQRFEALPAHDRDCLIEYLKSLQVVPSNKIAAMGDR